MHGVSGEWEGNHLPEGSTSGVAADPFGAPPLHFPECDLTFLSVYWNTVPIPLGFESDLSGLAVMPASS